MWRSIALLALLGVFGLGSCGLLSEFGASPLTGWIERIFGNGKSSQALEADARRSRIRNSNNPTNFTDIMQRLWDLDTGGFSSESMRLDIQGKTNSTSKKDMAPRKLFSYVNETKLFESPTVRAMEDLMDNYITETQKNETETAQERAEIDAFVDAICETEVMKEAHEYLRGKGKPFPTMASFKATLKEVWFSLYPRSRNYTHPLDSSGFEHVFLGESKRKAKEIGGMHHWITAYLLEKRGQFDYTGYVGTYYELAPGRVIMAAKMRAYSNYWKNPMSSFIFGVSPEFDMAAYTVCYIMRPNKRCSFTLQGKSLGLQVMKFSKGNHVETAYPYIPY